MMKKDIDWEYVINIRRSTRSYEMREVEVNTMSSLEKFVSEIKVPFEHDVKMRFLKAEKGKVMYPSRQTAPPDHVAFMTNTDILSISKAGFVGEMVILYATHLGLSTCWYGHYSLDELERVMPHLGEHKAVSLPGPLVGGDGKGEVQGERAICITPLGYWKQEGVRLFDRIQTSLLSFKRKSLDELLENGMKEENLPAGISFALDLARKAPSAANMQFWRFTISPNFKTVSIAMPVGYKHIKWEHPNVDIGICACHFWLGLMMKNVDCKISLSEEQGRTVWRFEII